MCGIVAHIGSSDLTVGTAMLEAIRHRGGDELRVQKMGDRCILGISRLSIVDVGGGSQPFTDPSDELHLVGNGEIYNHLALRQDLSYDLSFSSSSDIEVILPLYKKHREGCARFLDGMFAFVIHDAQTGEFLACRDRYGIKPLYYAKTRNGWYFASEAKSFLHIPEPIDTFDLIEPDSLRPKSVPNARVLRALLDSSVEKHLMMDTNIKVGTLLSGGVDSSVITALAAQYRSDITAFTVGVPGSPDVQSAERVCEHLGVEHVIRWLDLDEAREMIAEAVRCTESFNSALVLEGLMTLLLARVIREKGVKVVLCGEGADEIFGGYGVFLNRKPDDFQRCIQMALSNIHNTECLRLDRATMACSLEARVPFLDPQLVDYVTNLPMQSLLSSVDGKVVEKHILRMACQDLLPPEIIWRSKMGFYHASGILSIVQKIEAEMSDATFETLRRNHPEARLKDKFSAFLFSYWNAIFGDLAGSRAFERFGNYPVLQEVLDNRQAMMAGTGEVGVAS
jgi:asparagine synthase (glutamine-hydrolysing)